LRDDERVNVSCELAFGRRHCGTRSLYAALWIGTAGPAAIAEACVNLLRVVPGTSGTLRELKAHRKELVDRKITAYRGRIVKTTGDGMLVEFVSVVDAVRCAVDIQRSMIERNANIPAENRIQFRIGINVGDIISDDNDIYGDGVNVGARLEAFAEPGGIMISRNVNRGGRFRPQGHSTANQVHRQSSDLLREPSAGGSASRGARGARTAQGVAARNFDCLDRKICAVYGGPEWRNSSTACGRPDCNRAGSRASLNPNQ
jgi:hypothetical protein